jgi:energy-coupling factor transporter ATP-binding protein EcfA2
MDPVARRFMWEIISDISTKREKCSIILTTQSMEECEALCTRIGIMVGGRLRCLGSGQHLRDRFGLGYQLEISFTVPDADVDPIAHEKMLEIQRVLAINNTNEVAPVDVDMEEGEIAPTGSDSIRISELQVRQSLEKLGKSEWLSRISKSGSGSELLLAIETNKSVGLKHFATWWIMEEIVDGFIKFADRNLRGYALRERQMNRLRLAVPILAPKAEGEDQTAEPRTLSKMFGCIEPSKEQLHIKEYSVAQTSLEQIFNTFAAKQNEEADENTGIM